MSKEHEQGLFEVLQKVGAAPGPPPPAPDPTEVIEDKPHPEEHGSPPTPALASLTVTARNLFRNPDAHPIALDLVLVRRYGVDWLEWEPETLEHVLPVDLRGSVSEVNLVKVHACKALHLVDTFWQRWEVFVWCTMSLNGVPPDFTRMQVPTFAQCLVATDIANRIRDDVPYSEEVKLFIQAVMSHDGILMSQPPIDVSPLEVEGVDLKHLAARWQDVLSQGKAPMGDTLEEEQLRRMLSGRDFLEESRARLQQQIELVPHV